jgi:hypothetical protein
MTGFVPIIDNDDRVVSAGKGALILNGFAPDIAKGGILKKWNGSGWEVVY